MIGDTYQDPEGQWWFSYDDELVGPYDRKSDAEDDRRGLRNFDRHKDEPGYVTVG